MKSFQAHLNLFQMIEVGFSTVTKLKEKRGNPTCLSEFSIGGMNCTTKNYIFQPENAPLHFSRVMSGVYVDFEINSVGDSPSKTAKAPVFDTVSMLMPESGLDLKMEVQQANKILQELDKQAEKIFRTSESFNHRHSTREKIVYLLEGLMIIDVSRALNKGPCPKLDSVPEKYLDMVLQLPCGAVFSWDKPGDQNAKKDSRKSKMAEALRGTVRFAKLVHEVSSQKKKKRINLVFFFSFGSE